MYADFLSSPEIKTFDFSVFYTLNSLYIKANLNIYINIYALHLKFCEEHWYHVNCTYHRKHLSITSQKDMKEP